MKTHTVKRMITMAGFVGMTKREAAFGRNDSNRNCNYEL